MRKTTNATASDRTHSVMPPRPSFFVAARFFAAAFPAPRFFAAALTAGGSRGRA